jgi:tRNA(Ile)-lysidine synthase
VSVRAKDAKTGNVRERVQRKVTHAVEAHALWPAGATVVAAVSGGADSLCLLGVLLDLRERGHPLAPTEVVVAHLDHGLRGEAGGADVRFVAALAGEMGLRCVAERADVAALARSERCSLEAAARQARYAFLRRVAAAVGAARICTGHTRDDQAETVLLHFLRGSGLAGLAGMAPLAGEIARPLLEVTRAETEAYCAARGWQPRADASNADLRFARNRVRHELLPLLERYNPNLRETLARNAALIAADERFLEARTDAAWPIVVRDDSPDVVELDLVALRAQPLALRHRLLRRVAHSLAGQQYGLEARHVELLDTFLCQDTAGSALDLPGSLAAHLGYDTLAFARRTAGRSTGPIGARAGASADIGARELPVPGVVELPEQGWRVRAWLSDTLPGLDPGPHDGAAGVSEPLLPSLERVGNNADVGRAEQRAYLDADLAGAPLFVRTWRPGDRFRPLGMAHEKKLQDFFADAKVPRELRHRLPLVFGPRHLLWVAGQRIDDRARVSPATRRVLALQLELVTVS